MSIKKDKETAENELVKSLELLKRSQITALQEQINPHFIYNALNLISVIDMSEHKKQTPITTIVTLLSDLLSSVINTKTYLVDFEIELEYLKKYMQLQNIKYKNKFALKLDIAPETLSLATAKFILQPIVENAITHGILKSDKKEGTIKITAKTDGKAFKITVWDNGKGISPEKLSDLQKKLINGKEPEERHIGLLNVNQRLRLIFGSQYGCSISSDDSGTSITFTLPSEPLDKLNN